MKFFIFTALVLFASQSFAAPSVGDYIMFNGSTNIGGKVNAWTLEKEVVVQDGEFYIVTETYTFTDQPKKVKSYKLHKTNIMDDSKIDYILSNCANFGGEMVTAHLTATKEKACKITNETSEKTMSIFYMKVPFGIASIVIDSEGLKSSQTMMKYTFGNK